MRAALLVAALAAAAMPGAVPGSGGVVMTWESEAWKSYKAAYLEAGTAKTLAELDGLLLRIGPLRRDLAAVFSAELAGQLSALISARASARRAALQPVRGKPIRTDWAAALREGMARLGREHAALQGLRAMREPDPWVEAQLGRDTADSATDVADAVEMLERERSDQAALTREARELLARLRPTLPGSEGR